MVKRTYNIKISITLEVKGDNPVDAVQTTGETFYIIDDKLYVPVLLFLLMVISNL